VPENKQLIKDARLIETDNFQNILDRQVLNICFGVVQSHLDLSKKVSRETVFSFPIKALDFESKNIDYIKETLRRLNIGIEWSLFNESGQNAWGIINPLMSPKIVKDDESGQLTCSFMCDEKIQEALLNPSEEFGYGKVDLIVQRRIDKKYVLALYELSLRTLKNQARAKTPEYSMEEYRRFILGRDDKYADWKDFKKKCIVEPCRDLKDYVSINASFNFTRRKGRTPTHVQFEFFKHNSPIVKALEQKIIENIEVKEHELGKKTFIIRDERLKAFCSDNSIYASALKNIYTKVNGNLPFLNTQTDFEEYLLYVMERVQSIKNVINKGKYFTTSLKQAYFQADYIELKKGVEERKNTERLRIERKIETIVNDNWFLVYELEHDQYTRYFLIDHPEVYIQLQNRYSEKSPFDLFFSGRHTKEQLLDNMVFLRSVQRINEITSHNDYHFPDFELWKTDQTNIAKKENLVKEAFENKEMLIKITVEKYYIEDLASISYYIGFKLDMAAKYIKDNLSISKIQELITRHSDNGLVKMSLDKYGINNYQKIIDKKATLQILTKEIETFPDFIFPDFEEWKYEFERVPANQEKIEKLRTQCLDKATKEVNQLFF
jgi:hypothetical protein